MEIVINGEPSDAPAGVSVRGLLELRELGSTPCAVEINRSLVPHREHAERTLEPGDRVEIVTLVGGG
ncbi:MAG: sulfur carrier protein ThiS [Planctomycetota bacterium]